MSERYARSEAMLARAERVVPGGIYGHTAPSLLVPGEYPYFFERASGSRIWDVDGNEYIDYRLAYGPAILGYADERVDEAARAGMDVGGVFALATEKEAVVAERMIKMVNSLKVQAGGV